MNRLNNRLHQFAHSVVGQSLGKDLRGFSGSELLGYRFNTPARLRPELLAPFTIFTANPEVNMMTACWLHAWDAAAKEFMRAGISQLHQQVQYKEDYGCKDDSVTAG